MEIITDYPKECQIALEEILVTYIQNPDTTEPLDSDYQRITVSTRDNGAGKFLNISTDNWSIESPQEMYELLNDFCKRSGIDLSDNN